MVYEIEKFKKILEYFALHFAKIHEEKEGQNVIDQKIINNFIFGENSKSGQGYNDDSIQQYMLEKSKIGETANDGIFSIGNAFQDQKVCISIDASGGYKGGSYLHLVDKQPNKDAAYGNQTNINPVVENNSFIAIEIGASTNNPVHIFPPLQYTFNELGLFCASPSFLQEETLKSFLEYYKLKFPTPPEAAENGI